MTSKTFGMLAASVAVLALAGAAHARTVFSSGAPADGGLTATDALVGGFFKLDHSETLSGAGAFFHGDVAGWDGSLQYEIATFDPDTETGQQLTVLNSGSASVTPVDTGQKELVGDDVFLFQFGFKTAFQAQADTAYYLMVHPAATFTGNPGIIWTSVVDGAFPNEPTLFQSDGQGWISQVSQAEPAFFLTAAPEPASWALMIAGFGLTGAALRGRRRAVCA